MGEMKERMLRGALYLAGRDADLKADALRCDELLARFNATRASQADERRRILADLLGKIPSSTPGA